MRALRRLSSLLPQRGLATGLSCIQSTALQHDPRNLGWFLHELLEVLKGGLTLGMVSTVVAVLA